MKSLLFEIENRPWKALLPPSLSPMRTHARSPARPQACVCACVRVNEFVSVCVRLRLRTHVRPRAACAEATPSTDEATTNNADSPTQKAPLTLTTHIKTVWLETRTRHGDTQTPHAPPTGLPLPNTQLNRTYLEHHNFQQLRYDMI